MEICKNCLNTGSEIGVNGRRPCSLCERVAARFERLTPAQQEQARQVFEDAHSGDGYRYQNYNDHRSKGKIFIRYIVDNANY